MTIKLPAPRRIILLGTSTDVGKTYVGVQLALALQARGLPVLGLKPIESGIVLTGPLPPENSDAYRLLQASTSGAAPCYPFREPISPHLAAIREATRIGLDVIEQWTTEQEARFLREYHQPPVTLIETAGGAFSPLSPEFTNFELACRLGEPGSVLDGALWILVAADRLGVLHDVGATMRALGGRRPDLIVLSAPPIADASTGSNARELEEVVLPLVLRDNPRAGLPPVLTLGWNGHAEHIADVLWDQLTSPR